MENQLLLPDLEFDEELLNFVIGQESKQATPDERPSRFAVLSADEIDREIIESSPKTTRNKAEWAFRVFREWHDEKKLVWATGGGPSLMVLADLKEASKSDLNYLLKFFVMEARNKDGERYSASTLKDLFSMLQYHW